MEILIFIFNFLLICVLVPTLFFLIFCSYKEKQKQKKELFFYIALQILFFLFDNFLISMTESIPLIKNLYDSLLIDAPIPKFFYFLVFNFLEIKIFSLAKNGKITTFQYIIQVLIAIFMLVIVFIPIKINNLKSFLFYLPNQLFTIYVGILNYLEYKKHKKETGNLEMSKLSSNKLFKFIGILFILFGFLIILEDFIVIFFLDKYNINGIVNVQYRNFSENLLSLCICGVAILYFIITFEKEEIVSSVNIDIEEIYTIFFNHYKLTSREEEICKLILEHQSNQEIATNLFLSVGTVKTHTHNIFMKLNIHKRNQIFGLFKDFKDKL